MVKRWKKDAENSLILIQLLSTSRFSLGFAISTFCCIKTPRLPRLHSPLPPTVLIPFWSSHRHILCAISPVIIQTRPLMLLLPISLPFRAKSKKKAPSQDPLRHLIRLLLAKSETTLKPSYPLSPPNRLTPALIAQMHRHQVL